MRAQSSSKAECSANNPDDSFRDCRSSILFFFVGIDKFGNFYIEFLKFFNKRRFTGRRPSVALFVRHANQ